MKGPQQRPLWLERWLKAGAAAFLVALLAACATEEFQLAFITPRGPGAVIITHARGESFCRAFDTEIEHCYYPARTASREVITINAIPDEGHEFVGWSPRHPTSWSSELDASSNPLVLTMDQRFLFYANFR